MHFPDHRAIRVRFPPLGPPAFTSPDPSPTSTSSGDSGNTDGGHGGGSPQPPLTTSNTPTTSPSTTPQTPSHTRDPGGDGRRSSSTVDTTTETTSSETPTPTIKSSSPTSSSETPTSSSVRVVVVSSSTPSTTSKSTVVAPTVVKATNTFVSANGDIQNTPMTTAPDATISPSDSAVAATGNLNVGAVVGGVAGGVAGIALFFFICMYIIRRRRESNDRFDPVSFRKSAVMVDDPFNARPPTMIERKLNSHNVAPSISSFQGPNMAGAGAYSVEEQQYAQQYMHQQSTLQPFVHQPIQPRQQFTFGQVYEQQAYAQPGSETGHGVEYNGPYSSEPQAQDIYAAEAYAYPSERDVIVSPGMQAQEMGHHQEYQQHAHDAYGGM